MTKEELKTWFFNKYNSCYLAKHEEYTQSIFMYYDPQFIRQKKLCRLTGEQIEYPSKVSGVCLFEQDYKNGYLYMKYSEITEFFIENYSTNWSEIKELIHGWLEEHSKMEVLTPLLPAITPFWGLEEHSKMEVLTPRKWTGLTKPWLEEHSKMEVLTPLMWDGFLVEPLEDLDSKMEVLTPNRFDSIMKNKIKEYENK